MSRMPVRSGSGQENTLQSLRETTWLVRCAGQEPEAEGGAGSRVGLVGRTRHLGCHCKRKELGKNEPEGLKPRVFPSQAPLN